MSQQNSSISSFKLFLTRIIVPVILAAAIAGWLFQRVFEKKVILSSEICGAYKVNRIIKENDSNEVPIFGASMAQGGCIPHILGSDYFNYGLDGTGADVWLFFLKEECKKKKHTPLIIMNFSLDGLANSIGDISNYIYNADCPEVRELLGKHYKAYFSMPIIKYFGQYETYFRYLLNDKRNLTKYTDRGAAIEKNKMTKERFAQLVAERIKNKAVFENDAHLESEYTELFKNNPDRMFVIIITPYHSSYFTNFKNYPDAQDFLHRLGEMKNVRVFNFGKVNYPDSMFVNTTHLNYDGAVRFSKELKDSLATLHY